MIFIKNKVTTQDIADELGLSRNTVSKALNNTGLLAEDTKNLILQKAMEMGYKRFSYNQPQKIKSNREIALFTTSIPGNLHFASTMLDYFQNEISSLGYHLSIYLIREKELTNLSLPPGFNRENVDGIIIIEMFNLEYSKMLCDLDLATLFVDSTVNPKINGIKSDLLYMDNCTNLYLIIKELIESDKTKFGFIGEYMHCHSFYERFSIFKSTLDSFNIPFNKDYCILDRDYSIPHTQFLKQEFHKMKNYPEVFICANDFIAIYFLNAIADSGFSVPDDFYLCGFDDSQESKIVTPPLTTIHIHSQVMGLSAVELLLSRIKNPTLNYRTVYTETTLKKRASTRH